MVILCSKCGEPFEQLKVGRRCLACKAEYQRQYNQGNKREYLLAEKRRYGRRKAADPDFMQKKREQGRAYWAGLRHLAIMAYGGYRCACCGETEVLFLTLDHIFNNGNEHRKIIGDTGRGAGIYKWLRDNQYPAGFQILCMNCNHGKALNGGVCPHKVKTVKASLG